MNFNTHDRIAKVGFKDGYLEVKLGHEDAKHKKDTLVTCKDDPHPDLRIAFAALEEFVREVLLWPSNLYQGVVEVKSVSFSMSEGTGVEGAVISGAVRLEDDPSGFNWNTPHRPFDQYSEGANAVLWSDEAQAAFRDLRKETHAFLEGTKRKQGDLFAGGSVDGKSASASEASEATPIGKLTDQVVDVVDGIIQEALAHKDSDAAIDAKVDEIGKAHGFTKDIREQTATEMKREKRQGKANVVPIKSGQGWEEKAEA